MEIGTKAAIALLALLALAIHDIVEMSEEIKRNLLISHPYEIRN